MMSKNTAKKIISVILSIITVLSLQICSFASNDDPMNAKLVHHENGLAGGLFDTHTHDSRFLTGYDIYDMIDISYHNESVNWTLLSLTGIKNIMIRVGYRGYTEGNLFEDEKYSEYITGALNAGMNVGVYFYSQAITTAEAEAEANFVLGKIAGKKITLPVAFDCEYAEKSKKYTGRLYDAKLSKDAQTSICLAFCDKIAAAGYQPMLYANKFMLEEHINAQQVSAKYPIWLASYGESAGYAGDYMMWQYTGEGSVLGVHGDVDRGYYYVKQAPQTPIYIMISGGKTVLTTSETTKFDALTDSSVLSALGGTVGTVSWQSSVPTVASVGQDGTVTALAAGTTEIIASISVTMADGTVKTFTDRKTVTVQSAAVTDPVVDPAVDPEIPSTDNFWATFLTMFFQLIAEIVQSLSELFKGMF